MNQKNEIKQNGYVIFNLTRDTDTDSTTPIGTKYTSIALCTQGEATIELNMENYHLSKGDCLCVGNVLYKRTISMSNDFRACVLVCDNTFAFDSVAGIPMDFMEPIYAKPAINISDDVMLSILSNYLNSLEQLQHVNVGTRHNELVILAFRSIVLLIAMISGNTQNNERSVYGQSDEYFRSFINLIDKNVSNNHEVSYYAEQLHITPKYLSEVCKLKSGRKAKEIISSFLISRIKQEIILSSKSVKTIAYEYGFADQSSMGKFFSKNTGQSPGEFRKSALKTIG